MFVAAKSSKVDTAKLQATTAHYVCLQKESSSNLVTYTHCPDISPGRFFQILKTVVLQSRDSSVCYYATSSKSGETGYIPRRAKDLSLPHSIRISMGQGDSFHGCKEVEKWN